MNDASEAIEADIDRSSLQYKVCWGIIGFLIVYFLFALIPWLWIGAPVAR